MSSVIGRDLRRRPAAGHEVTGLTRSDTAAATLSDRELGRLLAASGDHLLDLVDDELGLVLRDLV
jgi:hypothetical protein